MSSVVYLTIYRERHIYVYVYMCTCVYSRELCTCVYVCVYIYTDITCESSLLGLKGNNLWLCFHTFLFSFKA